LRRIAATPIAAALVLLVPSSGQAFSVLAHQAAVDQAWKDRLLPLIRQRFPNATQAELDDARAFGRGRFGGCQPDARAAADNNYSAILQCHLALRRR
jgi:hypothetical protein